MSKNDCSNCSNQMTGFDGGFFGLPFTCECRIHGETENREKCKEYEKRLTKSDLLMRITELEKENKQLRKELKELNRKYIAFSEATDKRLKEMMR